jgi:hypothetical protein
MTDLPHGRPERPAGAPGPAEDALRAPSALAAAGAGLVAAVAVPGSAIGLGVLLVALAVALAALLARSAPREPWTRVWAGLALLLAVSAVLRDASWVVIPSLLGALALGSLAMAGGRAPRALARGLTQVFARLPGGPAPVLRTAARVLPGGPRSALAPVLRSATLALPLLLVFGALFASADAAFAQIAQDALPDAGSLGELQARAIWCAAVLALAGALATARGSAAPADTAPRATLGVAEWAVALGSLNLLFGAFVALQATVLFGGAGHVLETAGLTYAEYAREGFGQLLVAAALTLAVIAGAMRWARVRTARERLLLTGLLWVLAALTLVVLASALFRVGVYQDAFGATRWRLVAETTLLWIGALLILVMAALATGTRRWLPRACVLASGLGLLAFVGTDPDRRIAERNVEHFAATGRIDVDYLQGLSADAVPALADLPGPLREDALSGMEDELATERGWAELNLARARARVELERLAQRARDAGAAGTLTARAPGDGGGWRR